MASCCRLGIVLLLIAAQAFVAFGDTIAGAAEGRSEPAYKWPTKEISVAFSTSLLRPPPNIKSGSDVIGAIRRSFAAWERAAGIEFKESFTDKQNVSATGAAGDGFSLITAAPNSENVLLFAKDPEAAAITRVFHDGRGGIVEADIVLNPYQQFSTDGTFGTFDLQSTLTHEIGHLLGFAHSTMSGSAMYENFAKNGVFGLHGFTLRTLSEIDKAAARARYGPPKSDSDCCGSVSAKLLTAAGRPAANIETWIEEVATGKIFAQATTAADGTVRMDGLPPGSYVLYSRGRVSSKARLRVQPVGDISVSTGETATLTARLVSGQNDLDVKYIGFNGQISGSVIPVNSGKTYTIYLAGKGLSARTSAISFSSPYLTVVPNSVISQDFGDDLSVISFEMSIDQDADVGEYTVFVDSLSGGRSAVVGGIAVRAFANPFSNFVLDSK